MCKLWSFYDVKYIPYFLLSRSCFPEGFAVLEHFEVNFLSRVLFFVGTMLAVAGLVYFGSSLSYSDRIPLANITSTGDWDTVVFILGVIL